MTYLIGAKLYKKIVDKALEIARSPHLYILEVYFRTEKRLIGINVSAAIPRTLGSL